MIKKKPSKKHAKKKAIKKISGTHTDKKSHNVKINVLSGLKEIHKEVFKNAILDAKGVILWLKKANGATRTNPNRNDYFFAVKYKSEQLEQSIKEVLKFK